MKFIVSIRNLLWLRVAIVYLLWHLLINGIGMFAAHELSSSIISAGGSPVDIGRLFKPSIQFDSYHYLEIIQSGYGTVKSSLPAFFPFFPESVKILSHLGIPVTWSGFLINFLAGYFACLFLVLIAREFFKDKKGIDSNVLIIFLVFPSAYFITAFYSEALFCALGFGAFYFALKRNWLLSCVLLGLVSAVRLPGLVFVAAVFVEYLSSKNFNLKSLDKNILWFLIAPLGLISYMMFLYYRFGDLLFFMHAYNYGWGYQRFSPNIISTVSAQVGWLFNRVVLHQHSLSVGGNGIVMSAVFLFSWLALVGAGVWAWVKKYPASFITLIFISAILFSLNSNLISVNRYILPVFPIYLLLADYFYHRKNAFYTYVAGSAMLLSLFAILFSLGHWTG